MSGFWRGFLKGYLDGFLLGAPFGSAALLFLALHDPVAVFTSGLWFGAWLVLASIWLRARIAGNRSEPGRAA